MNRNFTRDFSKAFRDLPKRGEHNLIKILCLGVGLAVGAILIAKVYFEQSFDNFYPHAADTYIINETVDRNNDGHKEYPQTSGGVAPGLMRFTPQIEAATRFTGLTEKFDIEDEAKNKYTVSSIVLADSCFFDVLPRPVVAGNIKQTLSLKDHCAIPLSLARAMGGDVMGKRLFLPGNQQLSMTIDCVYEDYPENSQFHNLGILVSLNSIGQYMWDGSNNFYGNDRYQSFVRLAHGTRPGELKGAVDKMIKQNIPADLTTKSGVRLGYSFTQLSQNYTHSDNVKRMTWILSLLAFILLLSSTMNYLLIVIGQMIERAKEMAIHKCYGAGKGDVHRIILVESVVHLLLAIVVAALLIFLFRGTITDLLGTSLEALLINRGSWILGAVCLLILLITGVLPGWLYSRIPVATAFRGYQENKRRWKLLLLAIQFTAAGFLLSLLVLIGRQYSRMINDDPGYKYDNLAIVTLDGVGFGERQKVQCELEKLNCVQQVTSCDMLLISSQSGDNVSLPDSDKELFNVCDLYATGPGYLSALQIPVVQGRGFTTDTDSTLHEVMVDRKFVEKMKTVAGWDNNVVGRTLSITGHSTNLFTICGVFENVRVGSITNPDTRPTVMFFAHGTLYNILVRFHHLSAPDMQQVNSLLNRLYPTATLRVTPYKTEVVNLYTDSRRFRDAVMIGGLVTLLVALIGLIGYSNDEVSRRRKEIAIRKVNGAEVNNILVLFMRDILLIALPALFVGGAGAAYVGSLWLQQFSERVSLNWLVFAGCGLLLLAIILAVVNINCYKIAKSNPVDYLKGE